jgi:ribosomal protein S27E
MTNLNVQVTFAPSGRNVECECSPVIAGLIADLLLAQCPGHNEKVATFTVTPAPERSRNKTNPIPAEAAWVELPTQCVCGKPHPHFIFLSNEFINFRPTQSVKCQSCGSVYYRMMGLTDDEWSEWILHPAPPVTVEPTKVDGRQKAIEALRAALGEINYPVNCVADALACVHLGLPKSPVISGMDENLRKTVRCIETALYHLGYGDKPDHLQE